MYTPKHFEESRLEVLHGLMRAHSLSTLVLNTADGLSANHVPLFLDPAGGPHGTLRGHVARSNPLWQHAATAGNVLAIFQGTERYITPSWYAMKQETGKVVPTWNYAVVHAHGPIIVHDDADWVLGNVTELSATHEAGRPLPWQVSDAPADFVATLLKAIVGIEIPIAKLEGKWKVSQNRPAADRAGVVAGLEKEAADEARAMAQLVKEFGAR